MLKWFVINALEKVKGEVGELRASFRAGDWIVNPEANVLIKDDIEHHIEPKVMKVLLTLATHQGHVCTKEELVASVWPNTFVSDDALTRCISILRRVTEDDAHEPRFIQTVPKVGYRLVAPILALNNQPLPAGELIAHPPTKAPSEMQNSREHSSSWKPWAVAGLSLVIVLVIGAIFAWRVQHIKTLDPVTFETTAFTGDVGEQSQPAFSPDGKTIAYIRTSEAGGGRRIYLKRIGSEVSQALNTDQVEEFSPVWSPDGKQIAFMGRSDSGLGIYISSVGSDSPTRKVYIPQEASNWERGALSWSPDGKSLAFPDHMGDAASSSIYQLELTSLRAQIITSPPAGAEGDLAPAYSPNGKLLAFTRASETAVRDIFWKSMTDGSAHQLTHDRMNIDSFTWDRDSAHIIFSSNRAGKFALWRIGLGAVSPVRMPVGSEDATQPATGPLPAQLAYTQGSAIWSIDRVRMGEDNQAPGDTILSSTQEDSAPALSPDDQSFAFQSRRSGNQEIWVSSISGDHLYQLTSANGPVTGSPSWSHHGDQILYDSRLDGHSHIFVIPSRGGKAKQLTFGAVNDIIPRWSSNDEMVYFRSNRGGRWQVWKVSSQGGEPQPVTKDDGIVPQESPDGKWLYYTRGDAPGIWRVPAAGGAETMVLPLPAAGYWGYWQVTSLGIFYLDTDHTPAVIRVFDPVSGQSKIFTALRLAPPPFQGLTVYKDGKAILLTRERNIGRHITLVQQRKSQGISASQLRIDLEK